MLYPQIALLKNTIYEKYPRNPQKLQQKVF